MGELRLFAPRGPTWAAFALVEAALVVLFVSTQGADSWGGALRYSIPALVPLAAGLIYRRPVVRTEGDRIYYPARPEQLLAPYEERYAPRESIDEVVERSLSRRRRGAALRFGDELVALPLPKDGWFLRRRWFDADLAALRAWHEARVPSGADR